MFKRLLGRIKLKDHRTSSIFISDFIDSVEEYVKSHPELKYNEDVKSKLIDAYVTHDDSLINKLLKKE